MTVERTLQKIQREIEDFLTDQRLLLSFEMNHEFLDLLMNSKIVFGEYINEKNKDKAILYFVSKYNRIMLEYNMKLRRFILDKDGTTIQWNLNSNYDGLQRNTLTYSLSLQQENQSIQALISLISPRYNRIIQIAKEIEAATKRASIAEVSQKTTNILIESVEMNSKGIPVLQLSNGLTIEAPNLLDENSKTIRDSFLTHSHFSL